MDLGVGAGAVGTRVSAAAVGSSGLLASGNGVTSLVIASVAVASTAASELGVDGLLFPQPANKAKHVNNPISSFTSNLLPVRYLHGILHFRLIPRQFCNMPLSPASSIYWFTAVTDRDTRSQAPWGIRLNRGQGDESQALTVASGPRPRHVAVGWLWA